MADCARESAAYERELWTRREEEARAAVKEAGCTFIDFPEEEQEAFRSLVRPLYQKYCGDYLDVVKQIQQA